MKGWDSPEVGTDQRKHVDTLDVSAELAQNELRETIAAAIANLDTLTSSSRPDEDEEAIESSTTSDHTRSDAANGASVGDEAFSPAASAGGDCSEANVQDCADNQGQTRAARAISDATSDEGIDDSLFDF